MTRFTSLLRASLVVIFITSIIYSSDAAAPQYVNGATIFGRCANFSIVARTSVSFNGGQTNVATGNVGVAPGTSITGSYVQGVGYITSANTAPAINCSGDAVSAYSTLTHANCTNMLANTDLAGKTLTRGVYCIGAGFLTLTAGTLSLDAQGDSTSQFIFQMATTLITSTGTSVLLLNGARSKNVYWQVGTGVTLALSSFFKGQILAGTAISVNTNVNMTGRFFAQTAVTFAGTDTIKLSPL